MQTGSKPYQRHTKIIIVMMVRKIAYELRRGKSLLKEKVRVVRCQVKKLEELTKRLEFDEVAIETAESEELGMGSAFDNLAMVEDKDAVGMLDGGQTMGNHDRGAALHQASECLLDLEFGFGIKGRSGLVEDEDGRVFQDRASNTDTLPLSSGEIHSTVADERVVVLGQLRDETVGESDQSRVMDSLTRDLRLSESDIVGDRVVEEDAVL